MSTRAAAPSPTAARKPRPGAGSDAQPRRTRISGRFAVLILVVFAVLALGVAPLRTYFAQRGQVAQLERQTQLLTSQNQKLQRQVTHLSDPAELERLARECLGMIKPGEIAFVTVPRRGAPAPPTC